jgi:hypothetical protein
VPEDRFDFRGVLLRDVTVRARRYEAKDVCQGRWSRIMRCHPEIHEGQIRDLARGLAEDVTREREAAQGSGL